MRTTMNSQKMRSPDSRPYTVLVAITALALMIGGCTSTPTADTETSTASTAAPETTAPTEQMSTEAEASAADVLANSVDEIVEAGSYAFEAKIQLSLQGQPTEIELEGWVDGSDRELVMKIDRQSVTTRVIDGLATVERDGETVEVPLTEAGSAPSILILKSIQNPTFETDNKITGKLNAADLVASDFDVKGSAIITVSITADGTLTGYSIQSNNDSWTVDVTFSDIGERPNV